MLPVTQLLASPSMHWASMAHPCGWGFGASTDVVTSQLVGSRYAVLLRPSLTGLLQVESLTASGQPPARSLRPIAVEASSMSGLEEGEREAEARVNSAIEKGAEARVRNPIDFACGQTNELQSRNLAGSAGLPTDDPVPASPMDPTNSSLRRSQRNVRKTARFSTPIGGVRNGASAMAIRPVQKAQPAHRSQRRAGKKPRAVRATATHTHMRAAQGKFDVVELGDLKTMENAVALSSDPMGWWRNGVKRIAVDQEAAEALHHHFTIGGRWKSGAGVRVGSKVLCGFGNYDAVHAAQLDPALQSEHTLMISPAHRTVALKYIPGLRQVVEQVLKMVDSLTRAQKTDSELLRNRRVEWLNGHVLNQSNANARFDDHQDTSEEKAEEGGAPDRKVLYTAVIKLSRGGTTSMQVCGHNEVHYRVAPGSGLLFRSNLHHRTCKAEEGVWKLALFFGFFLTDPRECMRKKR